MAYRVLVTEEFHPILVESLEKDGLVCDLKYDIDTQGVLEIIADYEVLIINSKIIVDREMVQKATKLKCIARVGSGLDIIDLEACKEHNIKVVSSPEGNANAVAEHALAMLLSGMNNLYRSQSEILDGEWKREENRGEELSGKKIGIVGYGHTGSSFARVLQGFEVDIYAVDIVKKEPIYNNVYMVDMETMQKNVEIVSLHIPLNESTFYLIDNSFFSMFENSIYFINTSRGKICKTSDMYENIRSGKIKKAMIDVFENEPWQVNSESKKLMMDNKLVVSPHIAGWTKESKFKLAETIYLKIVRSLC